jgi:hypothetical protein
MQDEQKLNFTHAKLFPKKLREFSCELLITKNNMKSRKHFKPKPSNGLTSLSCTTQIKILVTKNRRDKKHRKIIFPQATHKTGNENQNL